MITISTLKLYMKLYRIGLHLPLFSIVSNIDAFFWCFIRIKWLPCYSDQVSIFNLCLFNKIAGVDEVLIDFFFGGGEIFYASIFTEFISPKRCFVFNACCDAAVAESCSCTSVSDSNLTGKPIECHCRWLTTWRHFLKWKKISKV
jgi:hypothetical protein